MLNWSTIGDPNRNIGYTKEQLENDLKQYFGVSKVILIEGIPHGDRTRGHIDGIARFINVSTVVVLQCTKSSYCKPDSRDGRLFDKIGETIEAAGFNVIREPIESYVEYNGQKFDTNYVNWLVGNGFVIAPGFDDPKTDDAAKSRIKNLIDNAKYMLGDLPEHEDEWLGFRPTLPDFLPVMGPSKNHKNVFYCFGHHHLGWTLGPISGKIVSGMIAKENTNLNLDPYSSARFS